MEGDGHSPDVVKVHRYFLAFPAFYGGNGLCLENIANDGVINFLVVAPPLVALNIWKITISAIDLLVGSPSSSLY